MTLNEVKEKFKQAYARKWLEVVDEHEDEIFFKTSSGFMIKASSEDIRSYLDFEYRRSTYIHKPFETCLSSKDHFEQMISSGNRYGPLLNIRRGEKITFGDPDNDPVYVEISEASSDYKNYLRFNEYFIMRTIDRLRMNGRHQRDDQARDIGEYLHAPLTIKVIGLSESSPDRLAEKSLELIEGCLFNVSYLKGIALVLEEELPHRQVVGNDFKYEDHDFGTKLPLPRSSVNRDVARFYQRGMVVEDAINQFLSYYQILEYFFLSVSDEELYRKLTTIYNDPGFKSAPKYLDKVIQSTLNHKRESDETEMLRLVLSKHVPEEDMMQFINAYEEHLDENLFTKKRKMFGEFTEVRLTAGHVIGNVSKRVKLIRNALVHSSDRYNRNENFIPTRQAELEIRKEVPLVKFLAEKVIISTAQ
jgi:hypothetical protein